MSRSSPEHAPNAALAAGESLLPAPQRKWRRGGLSPKATPATIDGLDGRSAEKRFMRRVRRELLSEIPTPTQAQRALVERVVHLALRLHLMDLRFLANGGMSEHDSRTYLAWSNSHTRAITALGLITRKAPEPGTDHWQRLQRRRNQPA